MWLAMTTFDRFDIFQESIISLLKCLFPEGTRLFIADDCSSDSRVKQLLYSISRTKRDNLIVDVMFRSKNTGCDPNMVDTIKTVFLKSGEQFVVTLDSDAIYNPQWLFKMIEARDSVKDKIGMLSVYDSNFHVIDKPYNDLLNRKKDVGGFACMLNRDIFLSPDLRVFAWDWWYVDQCKKRDYAILCTKVSYAQHIGKHGTHLDGTDKWDQAPNFVP